MARLRAGDIGSISAWLPSRRSVDSQRGAFVMTLFGHVRSGRSTGLNGADRGHATPLGSGKTGATGEKERFSPADTHPFSPAVPGGVGGVAPPEDFCSVM